MDSYLEELYAHQEWADAEHWRAFEAHSTALKDKALYERLHHNSSSAAWFSLDYGPAKRSLRVQKGGRISRSCNS